MIEELVNHYTDGNKTKFAGLLGIKPQTINSWILRGTFDAELIYSKCDDVSADWLLSGEGSMIRKNDPQNMNNVKEELIKLRAENDVLRELAGLKKKKDLEDVG